MGWVGDLGRTSSGSTTSTSGATLPIVVVIDDGNGYRSIYAHFGKVTVKRGQTRQGRQADRLRGHDRPGVRLPPPLRPVQPARDRSRFAIEAGVAKRMKLPRYEIARIDPLRVLPERTKPPKPTPTPDPNAKPTPTPSPETDTG